MKTSIIRYFGLLFGATVLFTNSIVAQAPAIVSLEEFTHQIPEYKLISKDNNTLTDPMINSKILDLFAIMYKGVTDARWFEAEGKFLVKFDLDGRESRALFSKKGKHIYTISYGSEKHLPAYVRYRIKSAYFDHEITHAIEVNSLGKTAWIVKLVDEKRLITVRMVDDEIEETENYRRSR